MNDMDADKPCLALMGEFSAGKSTLANLLIGYNPLPVQVVATQLPPVQISYGTGAPTRVDLDGTRADVDLQALDKAALQEVAYLQIYSTEEFLKHCDLIDMPGISDPNMPAEVWERMITEADGVLWCSPSTQAWRQSEAAVWSDLPSELYDKSLLLLTRMDKLTNEADRARVLSRVRTETAGLFAEVLPISLLLATQEQSDYALWQLSGAEALANRLITLLSDITEDGAAESHDNVLSLPGLERPTALAEPVAPPAVAPAILPRRVAAGQPRRQRPI